MSDKFFLDTNIFVYSFDKKHPKKANIANELIRSAFETKNGLVSYQVVQEFSNVALKGFKHSFTHEELKVYFLKILKPICLINWSSELFLKSLEIAKKTKYSLYDSLIISAAILGNCTTLLTEDLSDGQKIEGLRIVNPF